MKAGRMNSRINRFRKCFELNHSYALASEIAQPLAPARLLYASDVHEEAQLLAIVGPFHALGVDKAVHAEAKRFLQRLEAAVGWNAEGRHNPLCFDYGETLPGTLIQGDSRLHPEAFFGGEKPATVVRQPVLGKHLQCAQQILARHRSKGILTVIRHISHIQNSQRYWPLTIG